MRRFRLLFLIVAVGLLAPLAVLVYRAQRSAALERRMRHQAVAERVFDEMERALSGVLERAEELPFDRFATGGEWPFAVGYFQIDPDGSVHPLQSGRSNEQTQSQRDEIARTVAAYWRQRAGAKPVEDAAASAPGEERGAAMVAGALRAPAQGPGTTVDVGAKDRLLPEPHEGDAAQEQVSAFDALRSLNKGAVERQRKMEYGAARSARPLPAPPPSADMAAVAEEPLRDDGLRSEAELAPLVGRAIDDRHLLLFRTVVIDTRGYRQGVLIETARLADWLRSEGLGNDGIAEYASVSFSTPYGATVAAESPGDGAFLYQHRFAEPFDDLRARLALRALPGADNLTYVLALGGLLLASGALGLAALYRMVSVVVSYAERRSNFVAAVSHELKTPLTAIRMYGEMLRDGLVSSDAKRDEYYRHITAESERLSRLINNVLEFARLEKGTRAVTLTTGALAPAVRELAELVRPHVEGQGFALAVDVGDALPPVRFERDALMQVLWNLVDNAVKYAREAEPKRVALRCWSDAGGVHVAVRDHGPGVAARHLGKIFEPFYRGESELTRRSQGTGLGLALVGGLVERMGARVSGRNLPEGGFEVEIVFRPA